MAAVDAGSRFAALVDALSGEPGVALPDASGGRRFGADTLRVDGSIFAMAVQGRVVLKLPRERVAELVDAGAGAPFENGSGRRMREWVALAGDPADDEALAREALAFVGARR
ncbi:hypothetical protein OF117_08360 [Geodermatophilus sp. YIM 151500]|uniref:MmcQ/YjbR family DNA-binding protein n=1 Tax=Geodermatophilus sp. YIM 151500 TaxID=2984531 RepID=UPI0021E45679|nr:MmcQ/YjbR family DNA-binding protein [Geodermatophilus sp. YIM 151500]MCV2489378.1 hypothetical protein [Geodermatophilus sp. YIM 151500]